jgi:hypothetical protein
MKEWSNHYLTLRVVRPPPYEIFWMVQLLSYGIFRGVEPTRFQG